MAAGPRESKVKRAIDRALKALRDVRDACGEEQGASVVMDGREYLMEIRERGIAVARALDEEER